MKFWGTNILTTVRYLPKQLPLRAAKPKELKLAVDSMIPKSLSNKGLSQVLPKSHWDKIRTATYLEYDHTCAICEIVPKSGRLHCHEIWSYHERTRTQRLDGFIALCDPCHRVKHGVWLKQLWDGTHTKCPNLAKDLRMHARCRKFAAIHHRGILESPDKYKNILNSLDDQRKQKFILALEKQSKAIMPCEHFLKVNNCSFKIAHNHFTKAVEEWGRRSRLEWQIDYGEYAGLLP